MLVAQRMIDLVPHILHTHRISTYYLAMIVVPPCR